MADREFNLGEGYSLKIDAGADGVEHISYYKDEKKLDARDPAFRTQFEKIRELAVKAGLGQYFSERDEDAGPMTPGVVLHTKAVSGMATDAKSKIFAPVGATPSANTLFTEAEKAPEASFISKYATQGLSAAGFSEQAIETAGKFGGYAGKFGGAAFGAYKTYTMYERLQNGTAYTRLLDASGVGADSEVRRTDQNSRETDLATSAVGTMPFVVTNAASAGVSGLRWLVGDAPHGKQLAMIIARDDAGASRQEKRDAVRSYIVSALSFFHLKSDRQQQNILDNIMSMKATGKLQNWGQLPGLLGDKHNVTILEQPNAVMIAADWKMLKVPDAKATAEALRDNEIRDDIAEAASLEQRRQRAQVRDIDWDTARDRLLTGGKDALMAELQRQMAPPTWEGFKNNVEKVLKSLDGDAFLEGIKGLWNHPLDSLTGAVAPPPAVGEPGALPPLVVLNPQTGKAYQLTPDQVAQMKNNPADPDKPALKTLRMDAQGRVVATTLDREELDKLVSGQAPGASADDINKALATGKKIEDSDVKIIGEDVPVPTLDDLKDKAAQISRESDPAKRQKRQEDFNEAYASAEPATRKDFIAKQTDKGENHALTAMIAAERKRILDEEKQGTKDHRLSGKDLAALDIKNKAKAKAEKYVYVSTGLRQGMYQTSAGAVRCAEEMHFDAQGLRLAFAMAILPGGERTYLREGARDVQAYDKDSSGQLSAIKPTDPGLIQEMLVQERKLATQRAHKGQRPSL